jgi:hypothetical protein
MKTNSSVQRVASNFMRKQSSGSGYEILNTLLGGERVVQHAQDVIDGKDTQAAGLYIQVSLGLAKALSLTDSQEHALSRLKQVVENADRWDAGLLRNNIFKAADSMGIKLPSFMFASETKQALGGATKTEIKMKNGDVVPRGTRATFRFMNEREPNATKLLNLILDYTGPSGRDYSREPMKLGISKAWEIVPGIAKPPGMSALQRMSDNAIATTPTGARTEPDGWGADGSPSWLLVLGLI